MKKQKKGQIGIYFTFITFAIVVIVIAAFLAPMGVLMNSELYKAGEDIMNRANESIQGIQDTTVRAEVNAVIGQAFASQQNNIEVNAQLFQYSWILIIGLTALVVFLYTRRLVEIGYGGFV